MDVVILRGDIRLKGRTFEDFLAQTTEADQQSFAGSRHPGYRDQIWA